MEYLVFYLITCALFASYLIFIDSNFKRASFNDKVTLAVLSLAWPLILAVYFISTRD